MDDSKNLRNLRNRKFKKLIDDGKPLKRLFTPEIKTFLKGWLVRRRDHPYPNRNEKKELAKQTGLTYIQICNWFANWRRKLKNTSGDKDTLTWGNLIKTYNDKALGNEEQFSLTSNDSIWEEPDKKLLIEPKVCSLDHCYTKQDVVAELHVNKETSAQCFQISSTSDFLSTEKKMKRGRSRKNNSKQNKLKNQKNQIINKYFKRFSYFCRRNTNLNLDYKKCEKNFSKISLDKTSTEGRPQVTNGSLLLTKWLKSAACFQPKDRNYVNVEKNVFKSNNVPLETVDNVPLETIVNVPHGTIVNVPNETTVNVPLQTVDDVQYDHDRQELDAAEALTFLSKSNFRL